METDSQESLTPFPKQEAEKDDNPQWMESSAVLQPMVPIRNIFKCVYVLLLSARGIGREKASHSRHIFSLFTILFLALPGGEIRKVVCCCNAFPHHCSNKSEQGATHITC